MKITKTNTVGDLSTSVTIELKDDVQLKEIEYTIKLIQKLLDSERDIKINGI